MTGRAAIVARHDLRGLWRDGRLCIAGLLALVLLLAAVASGIAYQSAVTRERDAATRIERERWLAQGPKNPHGAAHYGVYAFAPASPLALFDRGIAPFVGVGVYLEAHKMDSFAYRPAQDQDAVARFGTLTGAAVAQTLLPLLVILCGHAGLAGERERGTLRQLLVAGTARSSIALGKFAAALAVAAAVTVPAVIVGIVWAAASPTPPERIRIVALLLGYTLYLGGWAAVTIGISGLARSGRSALIALLALWLFACFLGPRLAADAADRLYPVPSTVAFRTALAVDLGEAHSSERAKAVKARILRQYRVASTAQLPFDWRGLSLQEGEEHGNIIFDRHFGALFDTYRQQDQLLAWSGILLPELAIRAVSESASGSDFAHHRLFLEAAEQHRRLMQRILNGDVTAHDREGTEYKATTSFWRTVPAFTYRTPPWRDMIGPLLPAIAALLIWAAGGAAVLTLALRRLRP